MFLSNKTYADVTEPEDLFPESDSSSESKSPGSLESPALASAGSSNNFTTQSGIAETNFDLMGYHPCALIWSSSEYALSQSGLSPRGAWDEGAGKCLHHVQTNVQSQVAQHRGDVVVHVLIPFLSFKSGYTQTARNKRNTYTNSKKWQSPVWLHHAILAEVGNSAIITTELSGMATCAQGMTACLPMVLIQDALYSLENIITHSTHKTNHTNHEQLIWFFLWQAGTLYDGHGAEVFRLTDMSVGTFGTPTNWWREQHAPCFVGAINFPTIRVFAGTSPNQQHFLSLRIGKPASFMATLDSSDSFELVNQQPLASKANNSSPGFAPEFSGVVRGQLGDWWREDFH
ncbi:hypothetical protein B0H14DRAFT_2586253 [Mycena olivaceomarginata]|nr:hypothetical protein B0H14DRAFT_2586253 [Mycena olivaceomarginata]